MPFEGTICNNALVIVDGMTTELAGQVKKVAATETESTTLTLESGVEIMFGTAENIRDKERVCLEIMKEHPDGLAYINVRVVDRPPGGLSRDLRAAAPCGRAGRPSLRQSSLRCETRLVGAPPARKAQRLELLFAGRVRPGGLCSLSS